MNFIYMKKNNLFSELSVEEYNKLGKNALKTHTLKVEEDGTEVVYKRVNGLRLDGKDYNGYPSIFNPEEYDGKKKFIGKTLYVIENSMKELGYKVYWKVLNLQELLTVLILAITTILM